MRASTSLDRGSLCRARRSEVLLVVDEQRDLDVRSHRPRRAASSNHGASVVAGDSPGSGNDRRGQYPWRRWRVGQRPSVPAGDLRKTPRRSPRASPPTSPASTSRSRARVPGMVVGVPRGRASTCPTRDGPVEVDEAGHPPTLGASVVSVIRSWSSSERSEPDGRDHHRSPPRVVEQRAKRADSRDHDPFAAPGWSSSERQRVDSRDHDPFAAPGWSSSERQRADSRDTTRSPNADRGAIAGLRHRGVWST